MEQKKLAAIGALLEDKEVKEMLESCYNEFMKATSAQQEFNNAMFVADVKKRGIRNWCRGFFAKQKKRPFHNAWLLATVLHIHLNK